MSDPDKSVLARELEYHEKLYSGFAQSHFAKAAVRALRAHMVDRIRKLTGSGPQSRILSLGCGIGDTELLLAPHVKEVVGLDLSPAAIRQAREDAGRLGIANARFELGTRVEGRFDIVMAIFFLHHVPDEELARLPEEVMRLLEPSGTFYSLDPSRSRLSGKIGRLLIPGMMKRYQTPDERELEGEPTAELFRRAGFRTRMLTYDFASSPLAGVFPGWQAGYRAMRAVDDLILKTPLRNVGSNFEIIASR